MVKCMCTWRQTLAVWPVLAVGGGSFAAVPVPVRHPATPGPRAPAVWPLTDVGGGIFSLVTLALFLKFVWKPKTEWHFLPQRTFSRDAESSERSRGRPDATVDEEQVLAEHGVVLDAGRATPTPSRR